MYAYAYYVVIDLESGHVLALEDSSYRDLAAKRRYAAALAARWEYTQGIPCAVFLKGAE